MRRLIFFILMIGITPTFLFSSNNLMHKRNESSPYSRIRKKRKESNNPPPLNQDSYTFPKVDSSSYQLNISSLKSSVKKFPDLSNIDLSNPDKWVSQYSQYHPKKACYRASLSILRKYNIKGGELGDRIENKKYANGTPYYSNTIQVAIQLPNGSIQSTGREQEGLDYLNWQLDNGHPVIVGLDDNHRRTRYNYDHTSEHFVVITGRLIDKEGVYYRFFEVAAHSNKYEKQNIGVSKDNKLRLNNNKLLIRKKGPHSSHTYTVVQIRKNEDKELKG